MTVWIIYRAAARVALVAQNFLTGTTARELRRLTQPRRHPRRDGTYPGVLGVAMILPNSGLNLKSAIRASN